MGFKSVKKKQGKLPNIRPFKRRTHFRIPNFNHFPAIETESFQKMDPILILRFLGIQREQERERERTVEGRMATVLAPADSAGGVEVLLDEMTTFLEVVDTFNAVAPFELLPQNLGLLNLDPLLPHNVLPHLQHRHRVLVWVRWIEVVRRRLIEVHSFPSPHLFLWCRLFPSNSSSCKM